MKRDHLNRAMLIADIVNVLNSYQVQSYHGISGLKSSVTASFQHPPEVIMQKCVISKDA